MALRESRGAPVKKAPLIVRLAAGLLLRWLRRNNSVAGVPLLEPLLRETLGMSEKFDVPRFLNIEWTTGMLTLWRHAPYTPSGNAEEDKVRSLVRLRTMKNLTRDEVIPFADDPRPGTREV